MLDLDLLRIRTFTVTTVAGGMLSASTSATWFLYPLFMSDVWGYSLFEIGLAMTPGPAILVVLAPLAGRLVDRHGFRWLLILGAALATLGTVWMAWRLQPGERYVTAFLPGTLGIGAGMAFMLGPANAAALRDVPSAQLGSANATYNTFRMAMAAIGIAISAAIIGDAPVGDRLDEFQAGWWTMVAVMSGSPLLLWWRYPRPITPASASTAPAA